ncbi:hypothetical protein [Mycolicibacterium baixiangningiae]|uniref:hypothetical protein n=1 Tax=Mycolicibacterium baixiangningiae TaxID=2761578 RepID=UPI0018684B63|nr:hypothetical protein [Mycolicibacterium baixiangningiae]
MAEQVDLVDNVDFAEQFAANAHLPGISAQDFAHRHLRTAHGRLLGGIRFRGLNTARPFIEVLAHSFDTIEALIDCVRHEWSNFGAPYLRLLTRPGLLEDHPDGLLDVGIHLARYRDMAPADGRVTLETFDSAEEVIELVTGRYARLARLDPPLASSIAPAAAVDLRHWHTQDQLRAIRRDGSTLGVLAVAAGAIAWITGDEINEEVINDPHTGHGYAASAQTAWAHHVATDRDQLLVGTIHRRNHASRITAQRAGRPRLLDFTFIALHPPTASR